jgi:hypothetical protein
MFNMMTMFIICGSKYYLTTLVATGSDDGQPLAVALAASVLSILSESKNRANLAFNFSILTFLFQYNSTFSAVGLIILFLKEENDCDCFLFLCSHPSSHKHQMRQYLSIQSRFIKEKYYEPIIQDIINSHFRGKGVVHKLRQAKGGRDTSCCDKV